MENTKSDIQAYQGILNKHGLPKSSLEIFKEKNADQVFKLQQLGFRIQKQQEAVASYISQRRNTGKTFEESIDDGAFKNFDLQQNQIQDIENQITDEDRMLAANVDL